MIIRADRRRAFRRDLPWLVAALPLAAFALWLESTRGDACAALFGVGRTRVVLWSLIYVPPLLVVSACVLAGKQALAVLRGGYWPPLDTPMYTDTLSTAGPRVRLCAIGLLVALAVAVSMIVIGYAGAAQFVAGKRLWERLAEAELACAGRPVK